MSKVKEIMPYTIEVRRHLHENPELSSQEFKTSDYLKKICREFNLEIEEVPADERSAGTGFIATLDTQKPGKTIALRTDIDALPIKENDKNLKGSRSVKSQVDGKMHACGHDGHMAILVASMKLLVEMKDDLKGKIIFVFEEGEESSTGIHAMVRLLKTKKIDAIYGNHLYSGLETGKVAVEAGPIMSASLRIRMKVIGKGGHVSRPDKLVNPVYVAAYILTNLAGAWANQIDFENPVTLGFSQIQGSSARNVIADEAKIAGSLRYFNEASGMHAYEVIKNVASSVAQAHQARVEFSEDSGPSAAPVINDEYLAELCKESVKKLGSDILLENYKWYASESFGHYGKEFPALFTLVGTKNDEVGSGADHHNEYFDLDESSFQYGIGTMVQFALDFLNT